MDTYKQQFKNEYERRGLNMVNRMISLAAKLKYQQAWLLLFAIALILTTTYSVAQNAKPEIPKGKQTTLGLYVTAAEAYDMWKANPDKVKILDVRMPEEYIFVGHPAMAYNIPLLFQTYEWDAAKKSFNVKPNPDFVNEVKGLFKPDDVILVTCRSGGRGAMAVNQLAKDGYKNVYNITDGIEGDDVTDPASLFKGKKMVNGWKNAGLPWTYDVNPELMKLPKK
jgi:rhodanese-related sulfurtransferase